jgi:hypothetical protein
VDNLSIAKRLLEHADQLEGRDSNIYRVRTYRRAAQTVMELNRPVSDLLAEQGRHGLEALPGIGTHLSYTIEGLVKTGEFRTMNLNDGHVDPEQLLTTLPGIGPELGRQIHEQLGITRLEELEQAAHDGRLAQVGIGPKRLRGLIDALAGRLTRNRLRIPVAGEPPVDILLAVDQEYRDLTERKMLATVSPRRFNPLNEPWLPVFQVSRGGWYFRASFSNSALAHRLGRTNDWVVISFEDGYTSGQRTVVTETRGDLRGQRVVRGRELECRRHYQENHPTVESRRTQAEETVSN